MPDPSTAFDSDHPMPRLDTRSVAIGMAIGLALIASALSPRPVLAADLEIPLVIRNHRFDPPEIRVPANQRVRLNVHNQDATPEEFESHSLNREKLIPAGGKAGIWIGPLKPGRYAFFGEFNEATAQGVVVAE